MSEKSSGFSGKLKEACGVLGIYDPDGKDVASSLFYGLISLQHRGQESCGIAVSDTQGPGGNSRRHTGMGLVSEVFKEDILEELHGNLGIGHVRYSTTGSTDLKNAQPLVINYLKGTLALAHNGNLVNTGELRAELAGSGMVFHTTTDVEDVRRLIGADSLGYLRLEDLDVMTGGLSLCRACFDRQYPLKVPAQK